jgi:two-component system response regulator NreC
MNRARHFEQVPLEAIKKIVGEQRRAGTLEGSAEATVARVKVLLADDSELTRGAIRRFLLDGHSGIELVGEACNFAQTIQMSNDLKPHVIVMDLRMPDDDKITAGDVKSQLNRGACLLAISAWNDEQTKDLAESFGAVELLDKMKLTEQLIPAIMKFAPRRAIAAA